MPSTVEIDANSRTLPVYNYVNIIAAAPTSTLVKTGSGILHAITVTTPASTGTIEADDALTHTNPLIPTITSPETLLPYTIILDIPFNTGLTIYTAVAAQNITITYL